MSKVETFACRIKKLTIAPINDIVLYRIDTDEDVLTYSVESRLIEKISKFDPYQIIIATISSVDNKHRLLSLRTIDEEELRKTKPKLTVEKFLDELNKKEADNE